MPASPAPSADTSDQVAKAIHQALDGFKRQLPPEQVISSFFFRAREDRWTDFQLGWALQVTWISLAPHFDRYGSVADPRTRGLHEEILLDLATQAAVTFPDEETQERITDILTETLPHTKCIWVKRNGEDTRISMADIEQALVRTATLEARTSVLARWGRALNHTNDLNAMGRGALAARVLDLPYLLHHGPMLKVEQYTASAHDQAVIQQLISADQPQAAHLTAATFSRRVSLPPATLGEALGMKAPAPSSEPRGDQGPSRPAP